MTSQWIKVKKVLVANRGEIAVRIIRTLHRLHIRTVCVYSTVDINSKAVNMSDESVCVGNSSIKESYLNAENILSAALMTNCNAIHPGYGFLSEDYNFARACDECGILFLGPSPDTIKQLGNKFLARKLVKNTGIKVIPGSSVELTKLDQAISAATQLEYPLLLKAVHGGGGKGIRKVTNESELRTAFNIAQNEAVLSFGSKEMYLEKVITEAKHVEVQLVGDYFGNLIVFPERDCSVQYHHQKILEESPCDILSSAEREKLLSMAEKIGKLFEITQTSTVEFLVSQDHEIMFMEVNPRIQVEHSVTEALTGVDFIELQIKIADHEKIQKEIVLKKITGHAIEVRVNAVNMKNNCLPSCGEIRSLKLPRSLVRIDSGIDTGSEVSPYYDSLLMKFIAHRKTRKDCLSSLKKAIESTKVEGLNTNLEFLNWLCDQADVKNGRYTVGMSASIIDSFIGVKEGA
ncbi:acetyl-CoA carboxylase biotin carboxylase subunit [Latilactobacillus sakei]|uniref:acetyl-CoA carboxylase biotin carboxylase subunit n=1 Tax=Latilactobacillus sakei TaxID=1599 RepID=UPI002030080B|nr:biotin carboxylase N-terminal domain-containing protein [Latilactobacillus sakei]MCM1635774.1 ATP-grasp domain-containing protein [Latilactobacillus sakei]